MKDSKSETSSQSVLVLLCNIEGQLEILSNPDVSLSQRTLSFLLLLFTLPIWSATTLWER